MFRRVDDFKTLWRQEAQHTLAVLAAIPDTAAGQGVGGGHRDLRRLAWHLVETLLELPPRLGLRVKGPVALGPDGHLGAPPERMADIAAAYGALTDSLLDHIGGWSNSELGRTFQLYGEGWTGAFALFVLLNHQTHHRGQMTVLMRQAGLRVPEVCGPVQESWDQMGVPPPAV